MTRRSALRKLLAAVALTLVAVVGCQDPNAAVTHTTNNAGDPTALTGLSRLTVASSDSMTGYNRDKQFGGWADEDKDGCDTRSEILERDAITATETRNKKGCVIGAIIADRYSGTNITEQPGAGSDVDIDHVVPLGNVWISGGVRLTDVQRRAIVNDTLNLFAVSKSLNRQKGDKPADAWLPPNTAFQCSYVARQVTVKLKYALTVTQVEHDAMARVLNTCPDEPLAAEVH